MLSKHRLFLLVLSLFSFPAGSDRFIVPDDHSLRKFHDMRTSPDGKKFILITSIMNGKFKCTFDYTKHTALDDVNIRTMNVNIVRYRSGLNMKAFETAVLMKVSQLKYDYVVVLDGAKNLRDDFYLDLGSLTQGRFVTISYVPPANINLSLNFDKLFSFLSNLNTDGDAAFTGFYLYTDGNAVNAPYIEALKVKKYEAEFNIVPVKIDTIESLRNVLNKIRGQPNSIVISNIDYIIDSVTGKILTPFEIAKELKQSKNFIVVIAHNECASNYFPHTLSWEDKKVAAAIDTFATGGTTANIEIPSILTIDLSSDNILFRRINNKILESALSDVDRVNYRLE